MRNVLRLLTPRSVAIVGASGEVTKIRGRLLKTLLSCGFPGEVYPVSRSGGTIQGVRAYPSLTAIGKSADLVMIAVPAAYVPAVLDECEQTGAGAVIVHTASDGEHDLTTVIRDFTARTGIPVLGPNTEGVYNVTGRMAANFTPVLDPELLAPEPLRGRDDRVSLVSQSGGIGFGLYGEAVRAGVGFRHVVITGAEAAIDLLDVVEALVEEGESRAIMLFAEGFKRPERFAAVAARAADRGIPLIAMKVGRSEAGQRAAVSHSGTLAGADTAYDAMFDRYGVTRVADPETLVAAAAVLSLPRRPRGDRVALVTTTGGAGGWASDLCAAAGLNVPELSDGLRAVMDAYIPAYGSTANPVDVTADALQDGGATMVRAIADAGASGEVDAVIGVLNLTSPARAPGMESRLRPVIDGLGKPVLFASSTPAAAANIEALREFGAAYASLRGCATGLAAALAYERFQQRWQRQPAVPRPRRSPQLSGNESASELLAAYGVPLAPETLARSVAEAVGFGREHGYPVVLKVASPDIPHKTEAKAVALDVADETALRAAYTEVLSNARAYRPGARVDGVLVQAMMPPGREMALGMLRDPDFGPLLMLGFGGIYIDVLSDVVFAPVPVGRQDAERMIASLRGADLLRGVRGEAGGDTGALADLIVAVSSLVEDAGDSLRELDLNPVLLYPPGHGVTVVDSLLVRDGCR